MPSIFGHPAVAASFKIASSKVSYKLFFFLALCSVLPDFDVITFKLGISYASQLGHRGFSHSLLFAFSAALILSFLKNFFSVSRLFMFLSVFIVLCSHILLDAMTNGGLGVALLWPFSEARYFLPWRPIEVSPISIKAFLSPWGVAVIKSELLFIWLPFTAVALAMRFYNKMITNKI